MASEIAGAVASIRLLMDVLKANKTLANYNELVAAVSEVNADLLSAQRDAVASYKGELALTKRVSELEKEIGELKNWEREAERYQLAEFAPGLLARTLKSGMEQGEPPHQLCANCFEDHKKSFLQPSRPGYSVATYSCPRCKNTMEMWTEKRRANLPDPTDDGEY